jgi:MFS family permease
MDNGSGTVAAQASGLRSVSRYQWFVFLVAWLGWTPNAADFGLYALVLRPALTGLLGGNPPLARISGTGGILSMMGLLGWAFGGFLFGILADYIGRVRALTFSLLLYSVFTALQGISHGMWDFAAYRFIAGLGTGAELMVGIPLLAEVLGESQRATITLYSVGTIAAGLTLYLGLSTYYPWYPVVLAVFGYFVFGTFSGFAIYLPDLFPTHLRATAVGFCIGSARVVTSYGPLVAGLMVEAFGGSFNKVTAVMTCCAVFSIIAILLGRETKRAGLPR